MSFILVHCLWEKMNGTLTSETRGTQNSSSLFAALLARLVFLTNLIIINLSNLITVFWILILAYPPHFMGTLMYTHLIKISEKQANGKQGDGLKVSGFVLLILVIRLQQFIIPHPSHNSVALSLKIYCRK